MLRRRRRSPAQRNDSTAPGALDARWQALVDEVVASRARLHALVAGCRDGPLRDRLSTLASRVDASVAAATSIAVRAQAAARAVETMDVDAVLAKVKDARRRLAERDERDPSRVALETEVQLLVDQHASLSQLANAVDDAADRLRLLDLRLDAAVARAAQMVLRPDALVALGDVDRELASVADDLNALEAGLAAVGSLGP